MIQLRIFGGIAVALLAAAVIVGTPTSAAGLSCAGPEPYEDLIDNGEVIGFVEREHLMRRPRLGFVPGLSLSKPIREWGEPSPLRVTVEREDWGWCDGSGIADTGWHYPAAVLSDRENPSVEIDRDWDGDGSISDSDAAVLTARFGEPAVNDPTFDRGVAWLRLLGIPVAAWAMLLFVGWLLIDRRSPPVRRFDVRYLLAATAVACVLTAVYGAAGILMIGLVLAVFASWSGRGATVVLLVTSVVLVPLPGVTLAWWGGVTGQLEWLVTIGWFVILALGLMTFRPRGRAATLMLFLPAATLPLIALGFGGLGGSIWSASPVIPYVCVGLLVAGAGLIASGGLSGRLRRNGRRWVAILRTGWIPVTLAIAVVVPIEVIARRLEYEPIRSLMAVVVIVSLALSVVSPSLVVGIGGAMLLYAGFSVLDGEVLQIGWEASVNRSEVGLAVLVVAAAAVPVADHWWGRGAVVIAGLGAGYATSGILALHDDYWAGDKVEILIRSIAAMAVVVAVFGVVRFVGERVVTQLDESGSSESGVEVQVGS